MRRLLVNEFMSLDGVAQAPGAADEDTSGGFKHGGWNLRYMEDRWLRGGRSGASSRRAASCSGAAPTRSSPPTGPNAPEEEQVIAEPLNTKPKYVASSTLDEPLGWHNATLLRGDVADAVAALEATRR